MKETMKKFGAWLLAAALAFAGAGVAQAETKQVATQEELNAAVAAADTGDTVEIVKADTYTFPNLPKNITLSCCDGVIFNCVGSGSISSVPNGCTVIGGEFNFGTGNYHGWQHAGFIQIKKAVLNGLFFSYGNMEFTECTFNAPGSEYSMWCYAGNVTYKDCRFYGAGKFFNIYNEGNSLEKVEGGKLPWVVTIDGCTFSSSSAKKAAANVKATCGTTPLQYNVIINNCKIDPAGNNFPSESVSDTLIVFNPFVQLDDINKDIDFDVTISVNGLEVYPHAAVPEIEVVTPTVSEEKGITQEIVEQIAANLEVAKVEDTGLKAALAEDETLKDAEAVVKVELTKAAKDETGALTFEIKPVVKGETETDIGDKVVGKPITFRVPLTDAFTKFAKVTHKGTVDEISHVEVLGAAGSRYVELTFNHFSEVEFDPELSYPGLPETAVKVADGFYQSGATYTASTDFYITSYKGLCFFRDIVNGKFVDETYYPSAIRAANYSDNIFSGKTVALLSDIDLNSVEWTPIGNQYDFYTKDVTVGKTFFYGTFDGKCHVIKNLKINNTSYNYSKADGAGLFGRVASKAAFKNLTIENVDIYAYSYTGALCGNAGSASPAIVIDNVHVTGKVSVNGYGYVGGLCGHGMYVMSNCSVVDTASEGGQGVVVCRYWQGGGLGGTSRAGCSVTDCAVTNINIQVYYYSAGGIVGNLAGPMTHCSVENVIISAYNVSAKFNADQCGLLVGALEGKGLFVTENSPKTAGQCGANYDESCVIGWDVVGELVEGGVTGGVFEWLPDAFVAAGYAKVPQGTTPETWTVREKVVAKIGGKGYATLAAAVAAVKENETIQLLAGTIEEGEITLPDTIKNVIIKGAADHASILKNTTLAHRTNDKSFDGLTIDGLVFDNGRFLVVEWGNGSIKNLTFTNNIFRNLDDGTSEAAVHLNVNAAGAVSGFTFENNVIDGCTGGQKSGIYGAVKGDTTIRNNTINNVAFRPICVQIIDTDGVDDNTIVTGNTFSGSSVGRLQIYGTENETTFAPEGTDGGSFIVNNNIFKDITASQQICCWGINTGKVTTDITGNYYDAEDPKMFWNDFKGGNSFFISETDIAANLPHANHDNFNYYTGLTQDGKIDPATLVEVKKSAAVAKIVETGEEYPTLQAAFAAVKPRETVELLCDVDLKGEAWTPVQLNGNFDGRGFAISNLVVSAPDQNGVGFFTEMKQEYAFTVKNVDFVNVDVKGKSNVGALFGWHCYGLVSNVIVSGTIKVEAIGGDGSGYTRTGVICGGWSYGTYVDVTVDGGDKAVSYVKGPKSGFDGRYVAGFVGHSDEGDSYKNCTVKNLTVSGKWLSGGLCGDGPGHGPCVDCTVEDVALTGYYSGALFGWFFAYGSGVPIVEGATVRNVTFGNKSECGTIGGYGPDLGVVVKNATIEGVEPLAYNYQVYVTEDGDNYHYADVETAIAEAEKLEDITVASDKIEIPDGYVRYVKGNLWGVREADPVVRVGEIGYPSIAAALAASSGEVEITLISNAKSGRIELSGSKNSQIDSLTIDLNGFVLTNDGGDAFLTENRQIKVKDSVGTGVFDHIGSDDCVWAKGSTGGVVLESGTYHLVDAYGLAYGTPSMLVIKGGTYNINPGSDKYGRSYVPTGYEIIDNGDGTWTVREKGPEVDVKDESGEPDVTDPAGQPIPEEKKEDAKKVADDVKTEVTQTLTEPEVAKFEGTGVAESATETKKAGDEHQIIEVKPEVVAKLQEEAEKKEETKDAKDQITKDSKVESRVEIVFNALEVKVDAAAEKVIATETSVQYEVKPKVKTTVFTTAGEEVKEEVVETVIPNSVIKGNPIKFRLAVDSTFGDFARVLHAGTNEDGSEFSEGYLAEVFTANDANGKKFVELSSDHFSTFKLTSTSETPVCRVDNKNYTSLAEAIGKGGATAEIVLLANIELTEDVTLGYNQTIDPGEFAISGEGKVKAAEGCVVRNVNGKSVVYAKPTEVTVVGDQKIAVCIEPSVLEQLGGATALATVQANGFQVWQNYVMGVDGEIAGNKLVPICKPNAENPGAAAVTITTPMTFGTAPAKTGIAVTYQLLKSATPKSGFTMVGEAQTAPVFAVDTSAEENATYWKIQAIFTPDAN